MRKLLAALLAATIFAAPAFAQKSKSQLATELATNWPDNTAGQITPAILRSTVLDIINSYYDLNGGSSLSCAAHFWVAALPTLSSISCVQPSTSDLSGAAAATQVNDTNVTLTLGGTPGSALLQAVSFTMGWTGQLALGRGGTGQATAAAARGASGLNLESFTSVGDTNTSIASTARTVVTSAAFTAARTWTLPAANSVNAGYTILVADAALGVTSTNTLTIQRGSTDTLVGHNGTTLTSTVIAAPGGSVMLQSDGSSKWLLPSVVQAPQAFVQEGAGSGTYTTPLGAISLEVRLTGAGGGGGGSGTSPAAATAGTATTFGSLSAGGGALGPTNNSVGGAGGTASGCTVNRAGGAGQGVASATNTVGGAGGISWDGGSGWGGAASNVGSAAAANSGSGGGGAGDAATVGPGTGGGSGAGCWAVLTSPLSTTYAWTVGTKGNGGGAGTGGFAGAAGADGNLRVIAHFQ